MSDNNCHSHEHEHEHEHTHSHEHDHAHLKEQTPEETLVVLGYMLEHNNHHGEDMHEIFHALEHQGHPDAAALVAEAMHFFDHGNEKLAEALKLLGGK
ncbi:MAG: hypothetical protein RSE64_04340 [Oscillospiraceae bacterium]